MKTRVRDITHYSNFAISVIMAVMGLLFLVLVVIVSIRNERLEADSRRLTDVAEDLGHRVKRVIVGDAASAAILARRIGELEGESADSFDAAVELFLLESGASEILFAPGCVVKAAYPAGGTPTGVGANLLEGEGAAETRIAVNQNRPMLAGPFFDEEGKGRMLYRLPVFIDRNLWGVIGITVTFPEVLERAFLSALPQYGYAVRIEDAKSADAGDTAHSLLWRSVGDPTSEVGKSRVRVFNLVWDVVVSQRYDFMDGLRRWLYFIGLFLVGCLAVALWWHYLNLRGIKRFLESLAMTDGLTGLPNRRSMMQALSRMTEDSARKKEPFVLLYMDLNGFKQVNDTHGHEKGDMVLRRTAEILQDSMKDFGFVGRVGGDEFVVLLEGQTEGARLDRIIEVLCKRLNMRISEDGMGTGIIVPVSASFGIASFPKDGVDSETLLHTADVRMYETKKRIKGSVRMGPFKPNFR